MLAVLLAYVAFTPATQTQKQTAQAKHEVQFIQGKYDTYSLMSPATDQAGSVAKHGGRGREGAYMGLDRPRFNPCETRESM